MTNKLFDDDSGADNTPEIEIPADEPLRPFLEKYKDPVGIAKALLEKDRFIRQLQTEGAELRSELTTRSRIEETVDRLLSTKPNQPVNAGTPPVDPAVQGNSPSNSLSLEEVEKLLEKKEAEKQALRNLDEAKRKLRETYGASWQNVLIEKGKELGESAEFFDALARKNPSVLLALVGKPSESKSSPSLTSGSVATQLMDAGEGTTRDKAYYDKLKASNPTIYWSPKVQNQMHQDAIKQGASFFNA